MAFKVITEEEYLAAVERGRIADETEPRAVSARYNHDTGRIEIELRNGCLFAFPAQYGQGLRGATPEQLAAVEILGFGEALHWEEIDADLGVPQLVAGVFGSKAWMRELGRAGGKVQSDAKARASRENGKKGGRPRKTRTVPSTQEPQPAARKKRAG
ncbi:DUF2442 domain-containing protein [Longimicrobium sp.]|uniref:DUF2442 domain-containing protein n=1 Tax=Longimicrobium sp. TaxID=2029185 RepID=UPI002B5DE48D|nr:DUF2442 domain-containing protein [Longimicrobium sp.]HSU13087.1 DUF2442 domain-containing protein [Longimicrobium sp.]